MGELFTVTCNVYQPELFLNLDFIKVEEQKAVADRNEKEKKRYILIFM